MDEQQQSRWRATRIQLRWAGGITILGLLIIVICGYVFGWKWTGLPKRTLWDWLQLLIIPAVLAGGGLWFNRQQREQELQTADRRAQDEVLQAYLDQIGQLLLDKNPSLRQAKEDDEVRTLARARTLTVLARLDGERKGSIVRFLSESTLIQKALYRRSTAQNEEHVPSQPVISLSGADLSEANLIGANLIGANLSGADLSGAFLSGANLSGAVLSRAVLGGANLFENNLRGADLSGADLTWANLFRNNLIGANLSRADLFLANLSRADLSGALVTTKQLERARSLEGAAMPDGQILKSNDNPDEATFKEWLKSRGKDRKNSSPS